MCDIKTDMRESQRPPHGQADRYLATRPSDRQSYHAVYQLGCNPHQPKLQRICVNSDAAKWNR
jgi:hypothetical protein